MSKILTSPPKTSLQISLPSKGCNKGTLQGLEFMARELAQFLDLPRIRIDYEDQLKPSMGDAYYLPLHTLKLEQAQQLGTAQRPEHLRRRGALIYPDVRIAPRCQLWDSGEIVPGCVNQAIEI